MARSGQILGVHFQSAIGAMLTTRLMFPEFKQTVDRMNPDQWYAWDLYVEMTHKVTRELPKETVVAIGKKNIFKAKALFVAQGFDSTDKVLKDWAAIYNANLRDTPREDLIRTLEFEPGRVVIEAGVAQVPALVEGYMRGFVEIFDHQVTSFSHTTTTRDGHEYSVFRMSWR